MGWEDVLAVLERCHDYYGDDRYRPCPLLRHLVSENAELGEGQLIGQLHDLMRALLFIALFVEHLPLWAARDL
jgi:hypothetical protein